MDAGLNGADGIFFMTDINADSWETEFTAGEHLHWYFRQFEFTSFISRLFREDQVTLLRIHLLQSFSQFCGGADDPSLFWEFTDPARLPRYG